MNIDKKIATRQSYGEALVELGGCVAPSSPTVTPACVAHILTFNLG